MLIRTPSRDEWLAYVEECPEATFFHSPYWYELWAAYAGYRIETQVIEWSTGRSALLPLAIIPRLKGLLKEYISSPAGTYGGAISSSDLSAKEYAEINRYIHNLGWYSLYGNPYAKRSAYGKSDNITSDTTHILKLSSDLFPLEKNWRKGHVQSLKKSASHTIDIRLAADIRDWSAYYSIYEDSLRRWGDRASSRYGEDLFQRIAQWPDQYAKLWIAEYDGELIAGCLCFYMNRHVVYWHGCSLESHMNQFPTHALLHRIITDAIEREYKIFDFNPSGGHEGVRYFKEGFGTDTLTMDSRVHMPSYLRRLVRIRQALS